MPLDSYTNLQLSVANWLNRQDLTAQIPDFIAMAEAKLNRRLHSRDQIATVNTTISTQYTTLPTDFRSMESCKLTVNGADFSLEFLSESGMIEQRAQYGSATGQPQFYTVIGNTIEVAKAPDNTYTFAMTYYAALPPLANNATNWLLAKHPDLYLYMTLLQSAPYLKEDERVPVWTGIAEQILSEIDIDDDRSTYGGNLAAKSKAIG